MPKLIKGNSHNDSRGTIFFNNNFDASDVKRIYLIENHSTNFVRGWQGHKIEQRWFTVLSGSFKIELIAIDNWSSPSKDLDILTFVIGEKKLDILHVPKGFISRIQSLEENSKLLVMGDYLLGEIQDEYRFEVNYFLK